MVYMDIWSWLEFCKHKANPCKRKKGDGFHGRNIKKNSRW